MTAPNRQPIQMYRADLRNIPQFELPEPFRLRRYEPGDEDVWLSTHVEGDKLITYPASTFAEQFGTDAEALRQRQYYLCDAAGTVIGTATAWSDDAEIGRIHWVLIIPEYQGRGLSKPMLTAVCNRLRELGHVRARLGTNTLRLAAIGLYLKFGFLPKVAGEEDVRRWRQVARRMPGGPWAELGLLDE